MTNPQVPAVISQTTGDVAPLEPLKLSVELNVVKHLGIGLYSSTPAVVTEIISNAWDADAHDVNITLQPENDLIVVDDNGHGMTREEVQKKFLRIGYSRRTQEPTGAMTRSEKRHVMGRKGIGKLAMFSLANFIEIVTRTEGMPAVAFQVDVAELLRLAEQANGTVDYEIKSIEVPADFTMAQGTRITLTKLNSKINKTEEFLRPRLARRFGVFSDSFKVELNKHEIHRKDAGFYEDIQFLWHFDDDAKSEVVLLAKNISKYVDESGAEKQTIEELPSQISGDPPNLVVKGFIASVDQPRKLGKGDESLNKLSIFSNGRLFQEDILAELGDARYFNSYLVGEIHADFLDRDHIDRATASREAIKHDDVKFQALRRHLGTVMLQIRDRWDDWRIALGYQNTPDSNPHIEAWINGFKDKRDQRTANRLMTVIAKLNFNNDDERNAEAKKLLCRSAIVGFEKLRARNQLDALETITDVLSPEFQSVFSALDDIEESYYLDIVRSRLDVIRKFQEEIVDEAKLEKVAQQYLFDHLWLLDPSWERVKGSEQWELTLTGELKRACPDADKGARLDIAYRTTAGRHVIIELKRPGLPVKADDLELQGRKYVRAMKQYYKEHPDFGGLNGREPPIDVFFLISKKPDTDSSQETALAAYGMKFLTYEGLINNATIAYQGYLDVKNKIGRIGELLSKI